MASGISGSGGTIGAPQSSALGGSTSNETHQLSPGVLLRVFGEVEPDFDFSMQLNKTPENILGLVLQGTRENWENYAYMTTKTGNRKIDDLLDILYSYFNNPNYEGPEPDDLNDDQQGVYDYVTTRLTQTTEFIEVAAVIPKVRAQVQSGIAGRGNTNPGISVRVDIETHGSLKK